MWLEYGTTMKAPEYLAINPMGKVPAVKHGDVVITEGAAICAYLADRFPEKGLIPPSGSAARAAFYRWLFFVAGPLEMAVTARTLDWRVPEGRNRMVGFGSFDEALRALELALRQGPYVCGTQFTAADFYVAANVWWYSQFGIIDPRPAFADYVARTQTRPAAQRANHINDARLQQQS